MAKQLPIDRARRLRNCNCPIHGTRLQQVGHWSTPDGGYAYLVGCPRRDCHILAWTEHPHGACSLTPEWEHLLWSDIAPDAA